MAKRKSPITETTAAPEGYTVLARRYRPQQFADLVGQEPVARALINALESNRVAHAYLFTGARGVGKTSTARILAKALNCQKGPSATPCDACDTCLSIATGEDVDVIEIDGASNRGIDEIRDLRQNVRTRPTARSRFKIYIIDEVHMLTREAFNALLKTLEEPPAHVKFIFATTEVQKIPVTILSRCQRFDFAGIGTSRIVETLKQIVKMEGAGAEEEALELVARRAGGSMRDAQSLLDQLLAFGGEEKERKLTAEHVHRLLGTANDDRVAGLASAVLQRDPKQALDLLGQSADEGLNLGELLDQLLDYWRDLMVVHCAGAQGRDLSVTSKHRDALGKQAAALPLDTIMAGLDVLAATKARLRGSNHPRVLMELALVRLARLEELVAVGDLVQRLGQAGVARTASTALSSPPRLLSSAAAANSDQGKKKVASEADPISPPSSGQGVVELSEQTLPAIWPDVLAQVGPMLAGELGKAGLPAISAPNNLVLRFPSQYNWVNPSGQETSRLVRVEEVLRKITGRTWNLRVESAAEEPKSEPRPEVEKGAPRYQRQRSEASQATLVKRAMDTFEAQIVHVDDGFGATPVAVATKNEVAETESADEPADTEED